MNLPNRLTLTRLGLAPVFVLLISFNGFWTCTAAYLVFAAASITDYYDGKIARQRNLVTNFGKLFDPVADKVLLVSAFVMLMGVPDLNVPGWTVVIIIAREFLITGARALAAGEGVIIAANRWGKTKAVIQMVYVFVFFFFVIVMHGLNQWTHWNLDRGRAVLQTASYWAAVYVAAYTLYSGVQFARLHWRTLRLDENL